MQKHGTTRLRCPTCRRSIDRSATRFAPFCSERCKLIDLGRWLDESYRIAGEPADVRESISDEDEAELEAHSVPRNTKLSR